MLIRRYLLILEYIYNLSKPFFEEPFREIVAVWQSEYWNRFIYFLVSTMIFSCHFRRILFSSRSSGNCVMACRQWDEQFSVCCVYTLWEKSCCQITISGTEVFEVLGEDPANHYTFRLIHKCACWNGCSIKWVRKTSDFIFLFFLSHSLWTTMTTILNKLENFHSISSFLLDNNNYYFPLHLYLTKKHSRQMLHV